MSGPFASSGTVELHQQQLEDQRRVSESLAKQNEQIEAEKQMLSAKVQGLESEIHSVKQQTDTMRGELERERVEKGDLVAQVDLFLAIAEAEPAAPVNTDGLTVEPRVRSVSSDSVVPSSFSTSRHMDYHPPALPPPQQQQIPARQAPNGRGATASGRPRPMSMLQPPGKFSGIPGPGARGPVKALPTRAGGGGSIMEGIAKMGAGARGY